MEPNLRILGLKGKETERIAKFALWRAIGFGIIGKGVGVTVAPISTYLLSSGFPTLGFFGGASLGLALRDRKRAGLLALAGAIGFGIGFIANWQVYDTGLQ